MSIISRRKTKDERREICHFVRSEETRGAECGLVSLRGVSPKQSRGIENRVLLHLVSCILIFILSACDFHGPWEYYPEETPVYQGVYTHGYIVAGRTPYICFSKVYELDESAAESFAFYDSAFVTVTGDYGLQEETKVELNPVSGKPNCFDANDESARGVAGKSYTMNAFFKWDSSGKKVERTFKAVATIPTKVHAKSIQGPSDGLKNENPFKENNYEYIDYDFLEYPNDMYTYNIPMEYDESVRGILMTLHYDNVNGGESQNTTLVSMFKAFMKPDSMGYYGMSTKHPEESEAQFGFTARMTVGGYNALDTMLITGFSLPVGKNMIRFYATDQAYADYREKVLESLEDPRITPVTNVENGMGVFSGMLMDSMFVEVHSSNYVKYDYIRLAECNEENKMLGTKSWNTKSCRLYQEDYCIDTTNVDGSIEYSVLQSKTCYPQAVKLAMNIDTTSWSVFLPTTVSAEDKSAAYGDGLKRYCVLSNFKSNKIADCSQMRADCIESLEKTNCMEYLWQWCSDRDWDLETYEQCGPALLSMIRIEKLKSPIYERVVTAWCNEHPKNTQCKK